MSYTLSAILSFSIAIAAIIGWIRFTRINPAYYPFIYCIWIGLINEIISFFLINAGYHNAINNNIYSLLESIFLTWQFKKWGAFDRFKPSFIIIISLFVVTWTINNFFISSITHFTLYFRALYSFIIVLLSTGILSSLIIRERKNLLKNSVFLICIAFIIYFTYRVLLYSFWIYGFGVSRDFRIKIISFIPYLNLFSNLIYALAVLWMQKKYRFSMPS